MPSKRLLALMDDSEKKAIHIKPQNRGKFTRYAKDKDESVQAAARKVVKSKTATAKLKKEAQFALNAKKFKH